MATLKVSPAQVARVIRGTREYTSIRIKEVGRYFVPRSVFDGRPIRSSALDVVSIGVGPSPSTYEMEALGNVVTSEMIGDALRLEIAPKVDPSVVRSLLRWSSDHARTLKDETQPHEGAEGAGLFEYFAQQLLATMRPFLQEGWAPVMDEEEVVDGSVVGVVDPLRTYERIFSSFDVAVVQRRGRIHFGHEATRVLATSLAVLARHNVALRDSTTRDARKLLHDVPESGAPFRDARRALETCERILAEGGIAAGRWYYRPALEAARPILKAVGRSDGGEIDLDDLAFRVDMAKTFQSALFRLTRHRLAKGYSVVEEEVRRLYPTASSPSFNPEIKPDILVRSLGEPEACRLVIDAKYKDAPRAGDHYQMLSYLRTYRCRAGVFVTIKDRGTAGVREHASPSADVRLYEFNLDANDIVGSMGAWLRWCAEMAEAGTS